MQSDLALDNVSALLFIGAVIFVENLIIFGVIWYILRVARHQLVNDAHEQATMISLVAQTHLELILDNKLSDINFSDEGKSVQKFDKIKTYLTKEFSRVNAETHKLLNIEGRVWTANNEQYNNFITNVSQFHEKLNRHTQSNDEILTIREKLDHLEEYLRILAP